MNLTNGNAASKIILTEDFVTPTRNKWDEGRTYPKNLVLSLVSLHITRYGKRILFQVLRAKPIIEKYYSEISKEDYISQYSWSRENGYRIISLSGEDAQKFIDEACYRDFDEEYLELTHSDYRKK